MKLGTKLIALIAIGGLGVGAYYYFQAEAKPKAPQQAAPGSRAAPVIIAMAVRGPVPLRLSAIGTVQPISTIAIKSQVDGQVLKAHFQEGQLVNKGDLLYTIDPRPFEAALRQAEANLLKDQAQLERARGDLARSAELVKKDFTSKQKYDEARANVAALDATVKGDEAAIEMARLRLEYTQIRAPISGRVGAMLVTEGNLVKANDIQSMVTLNQVQPMYIAFSVPEQNLNEVRRRMTDGAVRVSVSLPGEKDPIGEGELTFINNSVDVTTGTIQLKATFANADGKLTPGQFVNVTVTLVVVQDAISIPTQAIQISQRGRYVFVVKTDNRVEMRSVTVGPAVDDKTVVTDGLKPGEIVVTEGQLRLVPDSRVEPRNKPPA